MGQKNGMFNQVGIVVWGHLLGSKFLMKKINKLLHDVLMVILQNL
jgi:hypothetical protein